MYPGAYDGDKVKEWVGNSQWRALRADLARYKSAGYSGWGSEGFWALVLYRAQRAERRLKPRLLWLPLHLLLGAVKKLFTALTHMSLEAGADIGGGMLIPHVGPVRIHEESTIGVDCAIHHVVTIGAGTRPGGAQVGDHVLFGCHSCVLGPVRIGSYATIGAGALVIGDVPARGTAIGNPARILPGTWRAEEKSADVAPSATSAASDSADDRPAFLQAPTSVSAPTRTAYEALMDHGKARADALALTTVLGDGRYRSWTFEQYASKVRSARGVLRQYLGPQDPMMIFSRRTPACAALIMAAIGDRRSFSSLNSRWRWPQIRRAMKAASCRVLFVDKEGAATLEASSTQTALAGFTIVRIEEMTFDKAAPLREEVGPTMHRQAPSPGRTACTLFTSGSTGEPKGVCISEQDLAWRAETEVRWYGLGEADVLLNLLPFSFDVGLNQLLAAVYAGCETVLCENWLPADVLAVAGDRKVTGIPCVPSIWQDFVTQGLTFQTRGAHTSLRFITISGGDLSRGQLDQIRSIGPGVDIFKTYGQTEAFRATSLRPEHFDDGKFSVGEPFPGVTICIVLPDGKLARRNEVGELVHAGLGIMMGYLGDEQRTREKLRPAPFDPKRLAVFTGDSAFVDSAGRVHLVGRSDQMVKIMGNRVYPSEVRHAICEVPGVGDAIVLAEKNSTSAAILIAFVVVKKDSDPSELNRAMRQYLPGYMCPAIIEIVRELPRTNNGKPDAEALRPRAQSLAQAHAGANLEGRAERTASSDLRSGDLRSNTIAERIVALVQERVDGSYSTDRHVLSDVLDSISFLDIVSTVDVEFSIRVDFSKLGAQALRSPALLAKAILDAGSWQKQPVPDVPERAAV
ncbi:MAG: AMP-binding protein [Deltaproteobacteria bacterium]|nr:AMP-binding protein [Deltaproteobacteria bacterium]